MVKSAIATKNTVRDFLIGPPVQAELASCYLSELLFFDALVYRKKAAETKPRSSKSQLRPEKEKIPHSSGVRDL
jgi:hypothetical protein